MTSRRSFLGWIVGAVVGARFSCLFPSLPSDDEVCIARIWVRNNEGQLEYSGYPMVVDQWVEWEVKS